MLTSTEEYYYINNISDNEGTVGVRGLAFDVTGQYSVGVGCSCSSHSGSHYSVWPGCQEKFCSFLALMFQKALQISGHRLAWYECWWSGDVTFLFYSWTCRSQNRRDHHCTCRLCQDMFPSFYTSVVEITLFKCFLLSSEWGSRISMKVKC